MRFSGNRNHKQVSWRRNPCAWGVSMVVVSVVGKMGRRYCDKRRGERRALVGVYRRSAKILLYCGELVQGVEVRLHESRNHPYGIIITPR